MNVYTIKNYFREHRHALVIPTRLSQPMKSEKKSEKFKGIYFNVKIAKKSSGKSYFIIKKNN